MCIKTYLNVFIVNGTVSLALFSMRSNMNSKHSNQEKSIIRSRQSGTVLQKNVENKGRG